MPPDSSVLVADCPQGSSAEGMTSQSGRIEERLRLEVAVRIFLVKNIQRPLSARQEICQSRVGQGWPSLVGGASRRIIVKLSHGRRQPHAYGGRDSWGQRQMPWCHQLDETNRTMRIFEVFQ